MCVCFNHILPSVSIRNQPSYKGKCAHMHVSFEKVKYQ